MIYVTLFLSFCQIGLFCVGGGYASMPLIQAQVVHAHHWLTMTELLQIFAISQMTPGPIGINAATFVGMRVAGMGGAIAATMGFVTPSIFIMVGFAKLIQKYGDLGIMKGILAGMRPAVLALLLSAGVLFTKLVLWQQDTQVFTWETLQYKELGILLLAFCITRFTKISVIYNLLICGLVSLGLYILFH